MNTNDMLDHALRYIQESEQLLKEGKKEAGISKVDVVRRIMDMYVFFDYLF